MSEAQFDPEVEQNKRAYQDLKEQIRRDYAGQYVGMAFGRVIAADADFEKVNAVVDALDPQPAYSIVFPADHEPVFEMRDPTPDYEFAD